MSVTSDKASISGAFYHAVVRDDKEFWFIDNFVYYFNQAGFVTIAFTGSAGSTQVFDTLEFTSTEMG
jgi:hypothetical protein